MTPFSLRLFIFVITVLVSSCILINLMPLPASPFDPGYERLRSIVMRQPTDRVAEYKIEHALQSPKFDIGLFGNSRIMYVSRENVGLPADVDLFNFGIGSSSFRQTTRLVEQLAAAGKVPSTLVISFDHVSLGYAPLPAIYPMGVVELTGILRDFRALLDAPMARMSDFNAVLHTPIHSFAAHLGRIFNPIFIETRLKALNAAYRPEVWDDERGYYRADGSYCCLGSAQPSSKLSIPEGAFTCDLYYPLLEEDFRRIAATIDKETKVIVYESPLNPAFLPEVEARIDETCQSLRARYLAACRSHGFVCHSVAKLLNDDANKWSDISHPPVNILGAYIGSLLDKAN